MARRARRKSANNRNWYTVAGYITVAIILVVYTVIMAIESGNYYLTGMNVGISFLILFIGSFVAWVGLFKDANILRANRGHWSPDWWKYFGFGFGVPATIYLGGKLIVPPDISTLPLAVFAYVLTSVTATSIYLYHRHQYVGVP